MPDQLGGWEGRRRARLMVAFAGAALAVIGVVTVAVGLTAQQPEPPEPPTAESTSARSVPTRTPSAAPSATPSTTFARPAVPELDWSKPVRLSIPRIHVTSTMEDLALDSDGVMTTPQDPDKAGWFTPGPPPGLIGVSVIAGHVTWDREPAVFFRLGDLRPGDRIRVDRKDEATAIFTVTKIGQFAKDAFPTKAVYQAVDHAALRLITCGGVYDEATNRYRDNLIVWARMHDVERA